MKYGIVDDFRTYRTQRLLSSIQPTNEEKKEYLVLQYLINTLASRIKDLKILF